MSSSAIHVQKQFHVLQLFRSASTVSHSPASVRICGWVHPWRTPRCFGKMRIWQVGPLVRRIAGIWSGGLPSDGWGCAFTRTNGSSSIPCLCMTPLSWEEGWAFSASSLVKWYGLLSRCAALNVWTEHFTSTADLLQWQSDTWGTLRSRGGEKVKTVFKIFQCSVHYQ